MNAEGLANDAAAGEIGDCVAAVHHPYRTGGAADGASVDDRRRESEKPLNTKRRAGDACSRIVHDLRVAAHRYGPNRPEIIDGHVPGTDACYVSASVIDKTAIPDNVAHASAGAIDHTARPDGVDVGHRSGIVDIGAPQAEYVANRPRPGIDHLQIRATEDVDVSGIIHVNTVGSNDAAADGCSGPVDQRHTIEGGNGRTCARDAPGIVEGDVATACEYGAWPTGNDTASAVDHRDVDEGIDGGPTCCGDASCIIDRDGAGCRNDAIGPTGNASARLIGQRHVRGRTDAAKPA
ncbi:hypothetical protein [Rhodopseudomonas sp. RCAM05734]|uniref:hypothetical protein n=1 Tax=Rhodopseudomonas sp. RCAM05734 TaxID=3457549 RepID=UPI0040449FE2